MRRQLSLLVNNNLVFSLSTIQYGTTSTGRKDIKTIQRTQCLLAYFYEFDVGEFFGKLCEGW